jgi:predicted RNA-binding Zn ribbon-like protein
MTRRLVDGRFLPVAIAGHPALELCNTRAGWQSEAIKEYLIDFTALVLWAREIGLITPAEASEMIQAADAAPMRARAVVRKVVQLRAVMYAAFTTGAPEPLDELRQFVMRAVARSGYRQHGAAVLLDGGAGPLAIVDRCALQAHRLLEQYGSQAVGRCGGPDCGWLFLDPTHRRRWCTMAVCGNRAKARRYIQRHRLAAS